MRGSTQKMGGVSAATVRRMVATDVPAALAILKESLQASMWTGGSLLESVARGIAFVAELDGSIVGLLVGRVAADEFEVLNLAVAKPNRQRGVATQLVNVSMDYARGAGAKQAYLEVRASNDAAISFYEKQGFSVCGRRANYYHDPIEDALILVAHNSEQKL